jgi:hypothetical protein
MSVSSVYFNLGLEVLMFQELQFSFTGVCPLLMHNGHMADPFNPYTKKLKSLTDLKKKSTEVLEQIGRMEWEAGLYLDENGVPTLPPLVVEATILAGAKKSRLGPSFKSGFFVQSVKFTSPGIHQKTLDELYESNRHHSVVRVNTSRVVRVRPIFHTWELLGTAQFDDEQLDEAQVLRAMADAGRVCGIGDYRPQYGRFDVVEVELTKNQNRLEATCV